MTKVPSLPYDQVIRALQRDGWVVVRQKGSPIRGPKRKGRRGSLSQRIFLVGLPMKLLSLMEREKANQWILIACEIKNHRQVLEELRGMAC